MIAGYIVLLDTETSMIAYIMQPWNKKPLQWMKPTHLAYGCSSCDCRACRDGYNKDYGPCGRLLNEEFSFLPYDLNCFHIIRDEHIIAELNKKAARLDLNVIDVYLDDSPQYDETYCSWKQALQDLCDKKGYTLYHHQLDGTSYQIHAGGISVNGYLSLAPNRNISDLKSMMYAYLYFALLNSPNYRQRMDTFYNFQCLELKEDKRKKY
ncbi:MAG TPA: hypothetical protein DDW28_07170 [Prevotella sp.]|nr:hypothetical protein [Candidatus Segatella violae]